MEQKSAIKTISGYPDCRNIYHYRISQHEQPITVWSQRIPLYKNTLITDAVPLSYYDNAPKPLNEVSVRPGIIPALKTYYGIEIVILKDYYVITND